MGCPRLQSIPDASPPLGGHKDPSRVVHSPSRSSPIRQNPTRIIGSRVGLCVCWLATLFVIFAVLSTDCYALSRPKRILTLVPRASPTEPSPKRVLAIVPRPKSGEARPQGRLGLLARWISHGPCGPTPVMTPFSMPPDALAL